MLKKMRKRFKNWKKRCRLLDFRQNCSIFSEKLRFGDIWRKGKIRRKSGKINGKNPAIAKNLTFEVKKTYKDIENSRQGAQRPGKMYPQKKIQNSAYHR